MIVKVTHQREALDALEQALMFPEEGIYIDMVFDLGPGVNALDCPVKMWSCPKCLERAIGVIGETHEPEKCIFCDRELDSAKAGMVVKGGCVVWRNA